MTDVFSFGWFDDGDIFLYGWQFEPVEITVGYAFSGSGYFVSDVYAVG